jgi:tetratricopeptide (TPR) repeat protein
MKKVIWVSVVVALFIFGCTPHDLWRIGKTSYDQSNYKEAIQYWTMPEVQKIYDSNHYRWLAHAYLEDKQYEKAIHTFKMSISLKPSRPELEKECWDSIHSAYLKWIDASASDIGQASRICQQAINDAPNVDYFYNRLYRLSFQNRQYDETIAAAKRAIELNPKEPAHYYYMGLAYGNKKSYQEGVRNFKKAIELDPKHSYFYKGIANLYYWQGNYSEALKNIRKASEIEPYDFSITIDLTHTLLALGNYEAAIVQADRAIKICTIIGGIGISIRPEGQYFVIDEVYIGAPAAQQGLQVGDRIIKINDASAKNKKADEIVALIKGPDGTPIRILLEPKGSSKSVEKTITRATFLTPKAGTAFALRSTALRAKGNTDEAFKASEKSLKLSPGLLEGNLAYVLVCLDKGIIESALKIIEHTNYPDSIYDDRIQWDIARAITYARSGKINKAVEIYTGIRGNIRNLGNHIPTLQSESLLLQTLKPFKQERLASSISLEAQGNYPKAMEEIMSILPVADEIETRKLRLRLYQLSRHVAGEAPDPEQLRKQMIRAEQFIQVKDIRAALNEFKKCEQIAPYLPNLYYNMAMLEKELNDYKNAISHLKIYVELAPDSEEVRKAKDTIIRWEVLAERSTGL